MRSLIARWSTAVKPTLKLSTRASYEWAFQRIEAAFGQSKISTIGREDVQAFLTHAGRSLAPESVRDLRARLRGLLSVAQEWGWIQTNPAAGRLRLPRREPVRQKVVIWPAQFRALVAALRPRQRAVVTLAALSGLRKGEIEALRWRDNLEPGQLLIDEAVYRATDGGKYFTAISTPKTRKHAVAIGPWAQQAINRWRERARFTGPDDFMFAVRKNQPADLHNDMARHVKPAAERLGLPRIGWHDLRHTYTTWGRLAGMKPEVMKDQLGHADIQTTLGIYSHASLPETRAEEAALVEEYVLAEGAKSSRKTVLQ
jgi:integrase